MEEGKYRKSTQSVASPGSDLGLKVPTPDGVQAVPLAGASFVGQRPWLRRVVGE